MGDHRRCIWPVGKWKDKEIDIVPNSYILWCLEQDWFLDKYPNFSNIALAEMEWRDKHGVEVK